MMDLLRQRRQAFLRQSLVYLRYVFNDHLVLVLLVLLGFLSLQYRDLLIHFPTKPFWIYLFLLLWAVMGVVSGSLATYLQEADQIFILSKEGTVDRWVRRAHWRRIGIWSSLLVIEQVLVLPLYLKLSFEPWVCGLLVLLLLGLKVFYHQVQLQAFYKSGLLDWAKLIAFEERRQQKILQFFSLFTRVKGQGKMSHERSYLNVFLSWSRALEKPSAWSYLYLRAYLRNGDFWPLTLRLAGLSVLFLFTLQPAWLAMLLVALLDYLLWFQLFPLGKVFERQMVARLYPLNKEVKARALNQRIRQVTYILGLLQMVLALVVGVAWDVLATFLVFLLLLNQVYLPRKSAKWID